MEQTLLLIEDDMTLVELLKEELSSRGLKIYSAQSGKEALEILEETEPSVILLDMHLPDKNGMEICSLIRRMEKFRKVPIIAISAKYNEPADRAQIMLAGADSFLGKPLGIESLWSEIKYFLDKKTQSC